MNDKAKNSISKFLSLVLRHSPEAIGLNIDQGGWAQVNDLIALAAKAGKVFSFEELREVVDTNDKKRFAFNEDWTALRASQGHSIEVELNLERAEPPEYLFHGTVERFLSAILEEGLKKGDRQHVHLSQDVATAQKVGMRKGFCDHSSDTCPPNA